MEGSEKFCLRWNDYERNISDGFKELREEKDFFDVTLACEDNQILAHRVIISACSPFFRNVLRRNPHQHPLLYLKGVKYKELLSILNFMYMGEVNVAQEELNSFLSAAEELKVKGLTQSKQDSPAAAQKDQTKYAKRLNEIPEEVPLPAQMKRQKVSTLPDNSMARPAMMNRMKQPATDIEEVAVIKTETFESPSQQPAFGNSASLGQSQAQLHAENIVSNPVALGDTYEGDETFDYHYDTASYDTEEGGNTNTAVPQDNTELVAAREEEIMSLILKDAERKMFTCALCQFGASSRHKAFCHIESKHFQDSPVTYTCPFCGKTAQTKNAIGLHISRNHKHERGNSKNSLFPKENFLY